MAVIGYRYRDLEETERKEKDIDTFCLVEFYRKEKKKIAWFIARKMPPQLLGGIAPLLVERLWHSWDNRKSRSKIQSFILICILSAGQWVVIGYERLFGLIREKKEGK